MTRQLARARPGRFAAAQPPVEPIDRYTLGHVAWGVMLGLGSVPWWITLGQAVLWEMIEDTLKLKFPQVFPDARPDTFANSFFDVTACMVGWGAIRLLPSGPVPDVWRDAPDRV